MAVDAGRLLGQVAEALNACERAGITVDSPVDAVMTSHGYVIAAGDPRLGSRWAARTRLAAQFTPAQGSGDD